MEERKINFEILVHDICRLTYLPLAAATGFSHSTLVRMRDLEPGGPRRIRYRDPSKHARLWHYLNLRAGWKPPAPLLFSPADWGIRLKDKDVIAATPDSKPEAIFADHHVVKLAQKRREIEARQRLIEAQVRNANDALRRKRKSRRDILDVPEDQRELWLWYAEQYPYLAEKNPDPASVGL